MRQRLDRGTLRSAGFTALTALVFLVVNGSVAAAADGDGQEAGGLLAALNVNSAEGVPLAGYELGADGGSVVSFSSQIRTFLLGGLFTLVRMLVGLACWLIDFVFSFPLFTLLLEPAQTASDAYNEHVVGALGLKGLLLAWGFVFGLILFMRGKVGAGLGEIVLTLTLSALAASVFIRPDYLLAQDGPIDQTHQAALEVAQITVSSHDFGGRTSACSIDRGATSDPCEDTENSRNPDVSKPLQDALTNALVVKPYQLLQYGQNLDPLAQADTEAYETHLKWVKGGYAPTSEHDGENACDQVPGEQAREFCEQGTNPVEDATDSLLPKSEEAATFDRFTADLEKAGKTGEAAAAYAMDPTWDRVGGALLLLIAVLLVVAIVGAMALVLLGTQAADLVAAACGGLAFVWGMLPGPSRQVVWKWLGIFMVSVLVMFAASMFLPLLGIAIDAILTDGPDLMVERLLLIDALAVMGLAFHRRLLAGASSFGQRLATRMRYAKVGGTHLPGDTSEFGAALGVHAGGGGPDGISYSGGLLGARGPSRAHAALGLRHRMLGRLSGLADGSGMPAGASRMLADAGAEARRGLAPLGLVKDGVHGALLGAHGLLIGRRPDEEQLAKWRKPTVEDARERQAREGSVGRDGDRPRLRGLGGNTGTDDGKIVDKTTGELLHDPENGRDLLSTRMHNKLVRFRGYRIARRSGRLAYGATYGLPSTVAGGRRAASRLTEETRTQMRVSGQRLREDGQPWQSAAAAARYPVQRAAVAARTHGPDAVRVARDTAAGAVLAASPSESSKPSSGPKPPVSVGADIDAQLEARRRILDALMRAQRATWEQQPRWGGEER